MSNLLLEHHFVALVWYNADNLHRLANFYVKAQDQFTCKMSVVNIYQLYSTATCMCM